MSQPDETGFGPVTDPADDLVHPHGTEPLWNESWYLDWSSGDTGGFTRVGFVPHERRALYWLHLVTPEGVVAVCDHDIPLLSWPDRLFLKSDSLWVDYDCRVPLQQWELKVEAYGVRVRDGHDLLDSDFGERVPVALDLQLQGMGAPAFWPQLNAQSSAPAARYEQPCRFFGEVVVGTNTYEVDSLGERDHSWGERDWWTFPWIWSAAQIVDDAGEMVLAVNQARVDVDADNAFGVTWHHGESHRVTRFETDITYGPRRWPERAQLTVGDTSGAVFILDATTVDAPVIHFDAVDGRHSRMIRPLMRFTSELGAGSGFVEFNQPLDGPMAIPESER